MSYNCLIIESLISGPDKLRWMADSQGEPEAIHLALETWMWHSAEMADENETKSQRKAGGESSSMGNQPRVEKPRGAVNSSSVLLSSCFFSVSCVHIFKQMPKQAPLLSK